MGDRSCSYLTFAGHEAQTGGLESSWRRGLVDRAGKGKRRRLRSAAVSPNNNAHHLGDRQLCTRTPDL